jgi:hypothetical protein
MLVQVRLFQSGPAAWLPVWTPRCMQVLHGSTWQGRAVHYNASCILCVPPALASTST